MNVIQIVADTLRRDYLGCYGNTWVHTPHLDKLAARSTVFDRHYLHNFPTAPARVDFFTGRYTSAYLDWGPLPRNETVLAQTLTNAGKTTFLVGDTINLFRDGYNFDRGFSGFEWIRGNCNDRWRTFPRLPELGYSKEKSYGYENAAQYLRNAYFLRREEDYFSVRTMRTAAEWLEENRNEDFFLHIDTFDPHEPWDAPAWYTEMYDPGYAGEEIKHPHYGSANRLSEAELKHCRALYAAEITLVDTWVGHLLQRIENMGLLDRTAIIFTSDHGFYLGEHGWIGKSRVSHEGWQYFLPLYEEVAHIPLMIYIPKRTGGRRITRLTQTIDLMPTVLDLAGAPIPDTVQGQSLRPLLEGGDVDLHDITWSGPAVHHRGRWRPSTIVAGNWALIYNGATVEPSPDWSTWAVDGSPHREVLPNSEDGVTIEPQLYDLAKDPAQHRNVLYENLEVAQSLHRLHLQLLRRLGVPEAAVSLREHL